MSRPVWRTASEELPKRRASPSSAFRQIPRQQVDPQVPGISLVRLDVPLTAAQRDGIGRLRQVRPDPQRRQLFPTYRQPVRPTSAKSTSSWPAKRASQPRPQMRPVSRDHPASRQLTGHGAGVIGPHLLPSRGDAPARRRDGTVVGTAAHLVRPAHRGASTARHYPGAGAAADAPPVGRARAGRIRKARRDPALPDGESHADPHARGGVPAPATETCSGSVRPEATSWTMPALLPAPATTCLPPPGPCSDRKTSGTPAGPARDQCH